MRIKKYEHCEGEEKYENISVFLVFFFFAHLQIFRLYSTERGIDEDLKTRDMLCWVAAMNNIKASTEEIVFNELILI